MQKLKIFLVFLICGMIITSGYDIVKINTINKKIIKVDYLNSNLNPNDYKDKTKPFKMKLEDARTLRDAISATNRINTVLLGTDGERTDTIIFLSYDVDKKLADVMSIPRDTYIEVPGYSRYDQHKINAVYNFDKKNGGPDGVKTMVSDILSVPIHYYAKVDYNGVKKIVDIVGGVNVNITENMYYDDPTCYPALHIRFKPGNYTLNGQKSIEYLRWRKNNDGTGGGSDLDRNKRQIEFLKNLVSKILSSGKLINIANVAYKSLETDMSLEQIVYYLSNLDGFSLSRDLKTHILPGKARMNVLSYFIHDPYETENLMFDIYTRSLNENNEMRKND